MKNLAKKVTCTRVQTIAVTNAGRSSEVKKNEEWLGVIPSTVGGGFTLNAPMLTFW